MYASAMSLVASCEPHGSQQMSNKMTKKVPQVVGKESESTYKLIDKLGEVVDGAIKKE